MCDACTQKFNRRALLRGVLATGAAAATSSLWLPETAFAGDGDGYENAAMGEDKIGALSVPKGSASSGTVQVPAAGSGATTSGSTPGSTSGSSTSGSTSAAGARIQATRVIPGPNANATQAPPVVTRAQWGADETIRFDQRVYAPVRKLIVHHTASSNRPKSPAEVVRFVMRYHAQTRGYTDTGYNYMIDHKGVIYEGRAARLYGSNETITDEDGKGWGVVGAHAKGNNAGSCGICLIGDFDLGSPTDASIASLVWLLAYKASRHRIDPAATEDYIDIYGGRRSFPNIAGHRQVGQTACPGSRLFKLLPAIRDEVSRRVGHYDPLLVDMPAVLRYEGGPLRKPSATAVAASTSTSGSGSAASGTTSGGDPGSGTKLVGVRIASSVGRVYTAGSGRDHASPSGAGVANLVALANTVSGDGYWALDASGAVAGFGGVSAFGDAKGKGTAADLAITGTGKGYWILMADGGIYPFGDAGYASSPKKAGLGGVSKRIVVRPQADGYWVLVDNTIRAFGAAPKLESPTQSGTVTDFCATPSGTGYWVVTDTGTVVAYGDATDKGDPKRAGIKWTKKPATHIISTPSGGGYIVANAEGAMLAFGDAQLFASFAGSGMRATGIAPAFG